MRIQDTIERTGNSQKNLFVPEKERKKGTDRVRKTEKERERVRERESD